MLVAQPDTPIPQTLWTDVCPTCGYSINGLPTEGICPECGGKYDQSEIVLHGFGRGKHENVRTAKPGRIAWVVVCSIVGLVFSSLQLLFYRWGLLFLGGFAALGIVIGILGRRSTDHPGQVQVRLNPKGCVQYDDLSAPSVFHEYACMYGWFGLLVVAAALSFLYRSFFDGPWNYGFALVSLLGAEIFLLFVRRKFVRAVARVRERAATSFNEAWNEPTPWRQVDYFDFNAIRPNSRRLSIHRGHVSFWSLRPNGDAVDIEFECNAERAKQLHDLLDVWMWKAKQERETADADKLLASIKADLP
jgi:hypothetical protein